MVVVESARSCNTRVPIWLFITHLSNKTYNESYGNKCDPSETTLGVVNKETAEVNMTERSIPRNVKSTLPDISELTSIAVQTVNTTVITVYGA